MEDFVMEKPLMSTNAIATEQADSSAAS